MTNLTAIRTAQHAGWQAYCWPFPGNGFPLTAPPSPSSPVMANPSPCRPPSPAHIRGPPSPTQLQRLSRAYEEHILQLTAAAAASGNHHVKLEPLSPDSNADSSKNCESPDSRAHNGALKTKTHTLQVPPVNHVNTPSPSASPKSQTSARTKTPVSFQGTPPHPAFTPPIGCFTPNPLGGLGISPTGGMGSIPRSPHFMEPNILPRNCSDIMRSLAAKYNNNNNNNELFTNQMAKTFPRLGMNPFAPKRMNISPQLNPSTPKEDPIIDVGSADSTIIHKHLSSFLPTSSVEVQYSQSNPPSSSTAAMRLNSAVKRSADSASPLDLSAGESSKKLRNTQTSNMREDSGSPSSRLSPSIREDNIPDVRLSPDGVPKMSSAHTLRPSPMIQENLIPDARLSPAVNSAGPLRLQSPLYRSNCSPGLRVPTMLPQEGEEGKEGRSSPPFLRSPADLLTWSVDDVCAFVSSIELCSEYAQVFREERIDGWCLSLLSESHLTGTLGMKLGPALKLRSLLSSTSCAGCRANTNSTNNNSDIELNKSGYEINPNHSTGARKFARRSSETVHRSPSDFSSHGSPSAGELRISSPSNEEDCNRASEE